MLESLHCPTCSAHYGLRPSRVRAGLRRARCVRCASVFGIEREVQRLLGIEPTAETEGLGPSIEPEALAPAVPAAPVPMEAGAGTTPSLTLGDLEGAEEEILEKTLVVEEGSPRTEAAGVVEESVESPAGGYSSAKDAIAKLLGHMPAPDSQQERRITHRSASQMDVEATLDALESTLGGVGGKDAGTQPMMLPPELTQAELEPMKPTASTLQLTQDEIASAMRAAAVSLPARPAPRPVQPPREPAPGTEANLLKVQVGQDVYSNVTIDQIVTWIEQGRVQDFHMVARQFSENWIEAGKVPSLRPVFDRLRRQQTPAAQQGQAVILPPTPEAAPAKKSLFGGLFNRG